MGRLRQGERYNSNLSKIVSLRKVQIYELKSELETDFKVQNLNNKNIIIYNKNDGRKTNKIKSLKTNRLKTG